VWSSVRRRRIQSSSKQLVAALDLLERGEKELKNEKDEKCPGTLVPTPRELGSNLSKFSVVVSYRALKGNGYIVVGLFPEGCGPLAVAIRDGDTPVLYRYDTKNGVSPLPNFDHRLHKAAEWLQNYLKKNARRQ
jgi:hypothetical protein